LQIESYKRQLRRNLEVLIPAYYQRLDQLTEGLRHNIKDLINQKRRLFESEAIKLESLNPLRILKRGYSVTMKLPEQVIISKAKQLQVGNRLKTMLAEGAFISSVESIEDNKE